MQLNRQQLLNGANSHLTELAQQTLQMHNEGLEIYQKQKQGGDFCSMGDEKSMFQQSVIDDDFEMESDDEQIDYGTDVDQVADADQAEEPT